MSASTSRLVRVFISSTFRDFMGERDELVKKIFPELRRRAKERFVEILEVDLRWGITEEQSRSGETLRICLEEIDRCRPSAPVFFIGLLGERYGWIPPRDYFKKDVLEDPHLGWVREHVQGKSVTELEILHGVLRNENMKDKSFFYFRNDGYERRHWPAIAEHHREITPAMTPEDFTNAKSSDPAADDARQRDLKRRVRDVSFKWEPKNYETPEELGTLVLEDLWQAINEVFPEDSIPTALERQYLEHQAFGESRAKGYVPRGGLFQDLDGFFSTEKESTVKVITGQSGGGKSALIAAWMNHAHAEGILPSRTFIHYIGGTPESSTARSVVTRLMETIRSWGVVSERMPDDFGEAVQLLPEWLAISAEGEGGLLLVLDALNQMESSHDQTLWWLPKDLPPGVKLIVSTLPGTALDELESRGWDQSQLEVPTLTEEEKRTIIASYLGVFRRTLEPRHVERLANAPQTKNPLFLKVVLDELRIRGRYEDLGDMIATMLEAKDPVELFGQVLGHMEEFDKERPGLVSDALGFLAAARRGLTESELLQLLSDHENPATNPLPRSIWSPVYLGLEESLVSRNGRLGFFHDFLRQAVIKRYLTEKNDTIRIHGRLGDVAMAWDSEKFSPSLSDYGLGAGAIHLSEAGDGERLWSLLNDEGYKDAQIAHYGTVDETAWSYKRGIDFFASKEDEVSELRLFKICIKTYEMIEAERSGIQTALYEFKNSEDQPDRYKLAINKAFLLDEKYAVTACLWMLAVEIKECRAKGRQIRKADLEEVIKNLEKRTDGSIDVPVFEWMERIIIESVSEEEWLKIAQVTKNRIERLNLAIKTYLDSGDITKAYGVIKHFKRDEERMKGLRIIGNWISNHSSKQYDLNSLVAASEKISENITRYKFISSICKFFAQKEKWDSLSEVIGMLLDKISIPKLKDIQFEKTDVFNIYENLLDASLCLRENNINSTIIISVINFIFRDEKMKKSVFDKANIHEQAQLDDLSRRKTNNEKEIDKSLNRFALILLKKNYNKDAELLLEKRFNSSTDLYTPAVDAYVKSFEEGLAQAKAIDNLSYTKRKILLNLLEKWSNDKVRSEEICKEIVYTIQKDQALAKEEVNPDWAETGINVAINALEIWPDGKSRLFPCIEIYISEANHLDFKFNTLLDDWDYKKQEDLIKQVFDICTEISEFTAASALLKKVRDPVQRVSSYLYPLSKNANEITKEFIITELKECQNIVADWQNGLNIPNGLTGFENILNKSILDCSVISLNIFLNINETKSAYLAYVKILDLLKDSNLSNDQLLFCCSIISKYLHDSGKSSDAFNFVTRYLKKDVDKDFTGIVAAKTFAALSATSIASIHFTGEMLFLAAQNIQKTIQSMTVPAREWLLDTASFFLESKNLDEWSKLANECLQCDDVDLSQDIVGLDQSMQRIIKHGKFNLILERIKSIRNKVRRNRHLEALVDLLIRINEFELALNIIPESGSVLFKFRSYFAIGFKVNNDSPILSRVIDSMLKLISKNENIISIEEELGSAESLNHIGMQFVSNSNYYSWIPILLARANRTQEILQFPWNIFNEATAPYDPVKKLAPYALFQTARILIENKSLNTLSDIKSFLDKIADDDKAFASKLLKLSKVGITASIGECYLSIGESSNAKTFIKKAMDLLSEITSITIYRDDSERRIVFRVLNEIYYAKCLVSGYDDSLFDLYDNINRLIGRIQDQDIRRVCHLDFLKKLYSAELKAALIQDEDGLFDMQLDRLFRNIDSQDSKNRSKYFNNIFIFLINETDYSIERFEYFLNISLEADAFYLCSPLYNNENSKPRNYSWLMNATRIYPWISTYSLSRLRDIICYHLQSGNVSRARNLALSCPELGLSQVLAA